MKLSGYRKYKGNTRGGGSNVQGVKRLYFDIAVITAVVLLILCIIFAVQLFSSSTSDTQLRDVLINQARSEYALAHTAASQISNTGGSTTIRMLSQTRQHLYAISELNMLSTVLLDSNTTMVSSEPISEAISQLEACESKLLSGLAIEEPRAALWEQLNILSDEIAELT